MLEGVNYDFKKVKEKLFTVYKLHNYISSTAE